MRILGIADLHNRADQLSRLAGYEADVIAICGDLHDGGSPEEARPVLEALGRMQQRKLIVPGNMDSRAFVVDLWQNAGLTVLDRQSKILEKVTFLGIGGMVPHNPKRVGDPSRWYHQEDEPYIVLSELSGRTAGARRTVIMVHQPPRGLCDRLYNGEASGCHSLRRFIEERQPDLVLCGHIHEARGESRLGRTIVVNVGEMRRGQFALIDLDEGGDGIKVQLIPKLKSPGAP